MSASRPRFRQRVIGYPVSGEPEITLGVLKTYASGQVVSSNTKKTSVAPSFGRELCWDRLNPVERRGSSRKFRVIGPLTLIRTDFNSRESTPVVKVSNIGKPGITTGFHTEYEGVFACPFTTFDPFAQLYASAGGLDLANNPLVSQISAGMESEAWNIRPRLERAGLFQALYELREVPTLLKHTAGEMAHFWSQIDGRGKGKLMTPSSAAEDFLSYQFGWKPFLSDVSKTLDTILFAQQYLHRLSVENNRWLKRARTLDETVQRVKLGELPVMGLRPSGEDINQLCVQHVDGNGSSYYGTMEVWNEVTDRVWATGYFKYYRPEFDLGNPEFYSRMNQLRRYITLLGLEINPSHIYQIIPWSWLVDWFSNLGDIIERLDEMANDSVVTRDLCVMRRTENSVSTIHTGFFYSGTVQFTTKRRVVSKRRSVASSPYGFVLGGDLSATQLTILGALGLTRDVRFSKNL